MAAVPAGTAATLTYGNGHEVTFTYDDLGRTKTVTHANGPTLSYTYTGDGQLHSVTETLDGVSTLYLYQYDTLGNLVGSEKHVGGSPVLRTYHSYNADNKLSAQGWQIGSDTFAQTYAYDTWDGNLSSIVLSDNDDATSDVTVSYTYDGLGRLESVSNGAFTSAYSYYDDAVTGEALPQLKSVVHNSVHYSGKIIECNYTYEYDVNGNILSATFGNWTSTYVYDDNNQLIRENRGRSQYTQTWEYDEFGNITRTCKYEYTTGELGEPTEVIEYKYGDENGWGDLLTEYNGQTIEYDASGNPLFVRDAENNVVKSYTWTQGRHLETLTSNGVTWTYTYDANGMRTGRTDGTNTYEYIYAGDKLVRMIKNGEVIDFTYAGGQPLTMTYDGATYYYVLNGQGDVIGLTDDTGKMVIGYHYGAYGVGMGLAADTELAPVLVQVNPLLYRGYVYDRETKLYYLQSRYYDPELGRFINADSYASTGQGILGNNMFAYCGNNPVKRLDQEGTFFCTIVGVLGGAISSGIWGLLEGKTGNELSAAVLAGATEGLITGIASDVLLFTGATAGVAIGVMAGAGAIGAVLGDVVEDKETNTQRPIEEYFVDAAWGAGFGALFAYMGGAIPSQRAALKDYGFAYVANNLFEEGLNNFCSDFGEECVSNVISSAGRSSFELWAQIFDGTSPYYDYAR